MHRDPEEIESQNSKFEVLVNEEGLVTIKFLDKMIVPEALTDS